ncbi:MULTISPECIES: alpha/beta fold hydrolase [Burkholderia]|jgi:pimeloyl-ACP methyl ester carboxylesterase|uniref:Alpha/beta hydrolase n=2 Tax=Burkholderia cepacia complex TaxID=87882 RepID=A0AAP2HQ59_9BURK|nr:MULTISPECIES: alpha/beta hydrolase [Burkholderia]EED99766.1 hydrolase, alpha/beta fold family [Burkholderia multivorans CGD1]MBR8428611.1 alpha/beta hydrolase [Burkholderia cenocepacia]MBU9360463.1 alpha/beta hydrolase [Burkholderia multivorans]MBU9370000.1 alpha/beta hydrolase [Burkholderia multivorans]MDN7669412.1 alpha/beta hydrolase [Burkholderia vietnamiensis]
MIAATKRIEMPAPLGPNPVIVKGSGAPLVYLHGVQGQEWSPMHDSLAQSRTVYAPATAGSDDPAELRNIDNIHELVLYYDDLFDRLDIGKFDLVGHSFGGMVAAEYAAAYPSRVGKLVLVNPLGLWRDDKPVGDFYLVDANQAARVLIGDPDSEPVKARLALPEDPEARIAELVRRFTVSASVAHFAWPIAERGLARRLRRVRAETLIVWGESDGLMDRCYAGDFAERIAGSRIEYVPGAGHTPHFDQPVRVAESIKSFLAR